MHEHEVLCIGTGHIRTKRLVENARERLLASLKRGGGEISMGNKPKLASFWRRCAERFRDGYEGSSAHYWIEEAKLYVKCWVTQCPAGVYLMGKPGESVESVE